MRRLLSFELALLSFAAAAHAQPMTVQQKVDIMVRLCIAGGRQFRVTGGGAAGIAIEPLRGGVGGNLSGNLQITKSEAEGLVNGIANTLTQLQASEADKVRDCLAPVRQALNTYFFPGQPAITPRAPGRVSGWTITFSGNGAGGGNFANYGSKTVILPTAGAIDIRPYFPPDMGGRNILVKMTARTDQLVSEPGPWVYYVKLIGSPQSYTDCANFEVDAAGVPIISPGRQILTGSNTSFGASGSADQSPGPHPLAIKLDCYFQARQFPVVTLQLKTPSGAWRQPGPDELTTVKYVNPNVPPGEQ